jgi:hypothetical protein
MWTGDYIEKLHSDGMLKGARMMGASQEMVMANWDEQALASRANVAANLDMVAAELKKINYNLSKIIDLKKQDNYIVAAFCAFMFVMGLIFLIMSSVDGQSVFVLGNPLYYDVVCLRTKYLMSSLCVQNFPFELAKSEDFFI